MTPALKEWSAAVHALLDGRQTVLLRKGGIGEKRLVVSKDHAMTAHYWATTRPPALPARTPHPWT